MEDEPEFDEATCVTAGELRAAGLPILESIPDVAWVPRSSVRFRPGKVSFDAEKQTVSATISAEFAEPFRWVSLSFTVEKVDEEKGKSDG